MIKPVILLFLFIATTQAFAINDARTFQLNHRIKRSVGSLNQIDIANNDLAEWPLNENNSTRNDLSIGQCGIRDQRVYADDILVENSGPSTLNGTLEVCLVYALQLKEK